MDDRFEKLELMLTEQAAVIEDLHEMVAKQDVELTKLRSHVRLLLQRVAEAETDGNSAILADQKPPHW